MKDKGPKNPFFEKKEEKPIAEEPIAEEPIAEEPIAEEPIAKKAIKKNTKGLNDPAVPMRRKNRILGDGRDWFDTHPDA